MRFSKVSIILTVNTDKRRSVHQNKEEIEMELSESKYLQFVNPVYIGDRPPSEMKLTILTYSSTSAEIQNTSTIDELIKLKNDAKMSWININGFKDIDSIKRLCEVLEIHPLTIEDILHTEQQAKMEVFDTYGFLSIKTVQQKKNDCPVKAGKKKNTPYFWKKKRLATQDEDADELIIDQISIVIAKNVILSFQELSRGLFDSIIKNLLEGTGVRKMGTDYIAYLLIDKIVDEYFLAISHLEERIENFEERATQTNDNTCIEEVQETKKYLMQMRRAILPLKNNLLTISRLETFFQTKEITPFLQDLNENLNQTVSMIDHYREWLSNIMEVNLSVLSHQMNKIMKVFTLISTIFIPLTFIAGVYGMNFDFMPELRYRLAYPIVLCGMGFVAITMITFFKNRHWF